MSKIVHIHLLMCGVGTSQMTTRIVSCNYFFIAFRRIIKNMLLKLLGSVLNVQTETSVSKLLHF
jgi:hypothetical protein